MSNIDECCNLVMNFPKFIEVSFVQQLFCMSKSVKHVHSSPVVC